MQTTTRTNSFLVPLDQRVTCPDCGGTALVIFGHPNDPHHLEAPCTCEDGTIDLDEAIDRGVL